MKEFTCIVCPRGCHLVVDDNFYVTGNVCIRGEKYALDEVNAPKRNIATSIDVTNRDFEVVSVKTSSPIPKEKIMDVLKYLKNIKIEAPVSIGQVVVHNVLDTGADIVATKEIK